MRLTLVVRHPEKPETYWIFTRDDLTTVADLVAKQAERDKASALAP